MDAATLLHSGHLHGRETALHAPHTVRSPSAAACPGGFAHHVLTLSTKHPGTHSVFSPKGSHLSLANDKLKHSEIFSKPFASMLPC